MSETNLVRPSRDGDQFHYLWASRRCLRLLSPSSGLVAISIEGVSRSEDSAQHIDAGEEVIDVAEYYGSEKLEDASFVRYIQLKHSTLHATVPWTPSTLEHTLNKFAERFSTLKSRFGAETCIAKFEFRFVSNRPISAKILETVDDAKQGSIPRHPGELQKLQQITGLDGLSFSGFAKTLDFEGGQEGSWEQRNILFQDMTHYLADADVDAPVQLKDLVTRKATSEFELNPTITKMDVLRALKTDESHLFPAPCLIRDADHAVPREQEQEIVDAIVNVKSVPVIIHSEGGVGKSVFSTRIKPHLPQGSEAVVYDCFGNGQYRSASGYRHRHKDALVQIANELASKGLCHPLIPTTNADHGAYIKAFLYRLQQGARSLITKYPTALLCIVLDAADNAQMAAEEIGEARSFVRDLIREQIPEGVRIVVLCRTYRQSFLDPPPNVLAIPLLPFSTSESSRHLRAVFPSATDDDVNEFHRLSSQNPRVQAMALSWKASLQETLRRLGPNPTTVEDTIGQILDGAIANLRDVAGNVERSQIESICAGLAVLRPLIPISVLAEMSGVHDAAIRSFATDLGRPLIVTGDTIQFFDEPAEDWFRKRFRPNGTELVGFVAKLKVLSSKSGYVAAALPQLMLEAGQFDELVALALSSESLPDGNLIERRDVELQRLQFALKAALRANRCADAAKLALKAGGECAGDERQRILIQANTDLAAVFLESDRIQELISRRTFGSGWVGSHHAYEAGLMSGRSALLSDARSRLRMAHEWLNNWSRLSDEDRKKEKMSDADIAEIAIATFNIHGPSSCARALRNWRPRQVSFRAGRILARRFVDHGRYTDLDELALAAGNDLGAILAITLELRQVNKYPPKQVVERAMRLIISPRINFKDANDWDSKQTTLHAVTAVVEAACKLSVSAHDKLAAVLTRYLPDTPPRGFPSRYSDSRFSLLRAYTLRAALTGQALSPIDLAHPELRKELENAKGHRDSQGAREFLADIGALLPWHRLWASVFIGLVPTEELESAINETQSVSAKAENSYQEHSFTVDEIAELRMAIVNERCSANPKSVEVLNQWIASLSRPLYIPTLTTLARVAARNELLKSQSFDYARTAFKIARDERADAESKSSTYTALSRAILMASRSEAEAYFDAAVEVASKIGDENLDRWGAMLYIADRAASATHPVPVLAYRFARCAELTYDYVQRDKYFDWEATVEAITGLCPSSSFAILSRWRDRDFGWEKRLLPIAVCYLLERKKLAPKLAASLFGFQAQWNTASFVSHVLEACPTRVEKENVLALLCRYLKLETHSASFWKKLKDVCAVHGTTFPNIDELIDFMQRAERLSTASRTTEDSAELDPLRETKDRDWESVFSGLDMSLANDVILAYQKFRSNGPPFYHEHFFSEFFRHVSIGKEAEAITVFAAVPEFGLFDLRYFLEQLPEAWKSRLAVKTALANAVKTFCRRYCMQIFKSRRYEFFPFEKACEISGLRESDLVDVIITGMGEASDTADAGRLFTLVGLLAAKLSREESLEVLSFGLDLFDDVLEDKDGDGPWSAELAPPTRLEDSVAGYIFAGLAAPKGRLRWEAAHAVRAMCVLGATEPFDQLITLLKQRSGGPFVDRRLHFYDLHALQWGLIACARAATEAPSVLLPHMEFFKHLAVGGNMHVVIRGFAARTALALLDDNAGSSDSDLRQRLQNVNSSPFPTIASDVDTLPNDDDEAQEEDRFYFGIDMGPYWYEPLGRHFGKSQSQIEHQALRVIKVDWQYSGSSKWDEDQRARRKIFRERETSHSHGSYPRTDNLQFYLSYHAMMVVAGRLLSTTPLHQDKYSMDGFGDWLERHELTRKDGNWLSDRRDPEPNDWPEWKGQVQTNDWRWSVRRDDFDRVLSFPGEQVNLWGNWTSISGDRKESVSVRSALVSPQRAEALLRALQTATNPHNYRIPGLDDELEIDRPAFQLRGWIADPDHPNSGLDEQDPWAGDISYPFAVPAPFVVELMNLESDPERRTWWLISGSDHNEFALSAQVWGHYREMDNDREKEEERGERIQGSSSFVTRFLTKVNMDLIVAVEIDRRLNRYRYESSEDSGLRYIPASARLFLIKSDGNLFTI